MVATCRIVAAVLMLVGLDVAGAAAQAPTGAAAAGQGPAPAQETLKERLSDKASDEQRVNNCKVPMDRRGPKERPEGCARSGPDKASRDR